MSVEEWYCLKCKQKMETTRTELEYRGYKFRFDCLKCPTCGVIYQDSKMAKKIVESQVLIDKKMA